MATLTITLQSQPTQTALNLRRWEALLADPHWAKVEGRVETNRHGQVLMSPPPAPRHGSFQVRIAVLLDQLMPGGRVLSECPISTADGVRAADVAWASSERMRDLGNRACFVRAPEICVEIQSPGDRASEVREKAALYFAAGAKEVWLCEPSGAMRFLAAGGKSRAASALCPTFPKKVTLR